MSQIKYGNSYRSITLKGSNFKNEILNNEHIISIDNYIKENYLKLNGYIEMLIDINFIYIDDIVGFVINEDITKLERYIKIYLKFHNIYFESFDYYFDKEEKRPYYKLIIDLNFPYLD